MSNNDHDQIQPANANLGVEADALHKPPEILKRGHLLPSEWDHRFDKNNQPIPTKSEDTPSDK
jgi:hypothetical protein